jgi:steroid delta-isomerase-like uncharacterized protein
MASAKTEMAKKVLVEIWGRGRKELIDQCLTSDYLDHDPLFGDSDADGLREWIKMNQKAFPDFRFEVEEVLEAGDKVIVRFVGSGTHQGELMGLPPSGRKVRSRGCCIMAFEGDKVSEQWDYWDTLDFLRQLGLVQLPAELERVASKPSAQPEARP